jgi:hypothetical protein
MKKDKILISIDELPKRLRHALEVLVEWHSVLVYEMEKGKYGFYIIDKYMPNFSDFTGLVESEYVNDHHFIQKSVLKIIETKFQGIRCRYFPKGGLPHESMQIEMVELCKFKSGLGFSIEIHSNDYGFLTGEEAKFAPAYAHVLDKDELEIGLWNITGPCPKKISDIKEFRPPYEDGYLTPLKRTPLMEHRQNLVKWDNSPRLEEETQWESTQYLWNFIRESKR